MNKIALLILFLFCQYGIFANQNYREKWIEANAFYKKGDYEKAENLYKSMIQEMDPSAEILYNLGNTYMKLGKLNFAILYYERAFRLSPRDKDILTNLEIANSKIKNRNESVPRFFLSAFFTNTTYLFSCNFWAILSLLFLLLTASCFLAYIQVQSYLVKKIGFFLLIFFLAISILAFSFANLRYQLIHNKNDAIVFSPSIGVKSEPKFENSTDKFIIYEGLKILILGKYEGWLHIQTNDGNEGWIPEESVEII